MDLTKPSDSLLKRLDLFADRHVGPSEDDVRAMLETIGHDSLEALAGAVVPEEIRLARPLQLEESRGERALTATRLRIIAEPRLRKGNEKPLSGERLEDLTGLLKTLQALQGEGGERPSRALIGVGGAACVGDHWTVGSRPTRAPQEQRSERRRRLEAKLTDTKRG